MTVAVVGGVAVAAVVVAVVADAAAVACYDMERTTVLAVVQFQLHPCSDLVAPPRGRRGPDVKYKEVRSG